MAEISHKDLDRHLSRSSSHGFSTVYLVFGESYLCKKARQALLSALVPEEKEQPHVVSTADADEISQVAELLEELSTLSFFTPRRVGVLQNVSFSEASRQGGEMYRKAKKAYDEGDMDRAAVHFLGILEMTGLSLSDAEPELLSQKMVSAYAGEEGSEEERICFETLISHSKSLSLSPEPAADTSSVMQRAIERGFPRNHHLILTAEAVDKRTSLYKAIEAHGTVIDCHVSRGARKKDREEQQALIYEQGQKILKRSGKTANRNVIDEIYRLIGFDLAAFSTALEKLVTYVGKRPEVAIADVRQVLRKSREEPIYELTGALSDRDGLSAIRLLTELLNSGYHHLQILMALTNQVRKLLLVKGFVNASPSPLWQPRMPYGRFRDQVMPEIIAFDRELGEEADGWRQKSRLKRKKNMTAELSIARQPKNPYPVYQLFLKSDNFSENELKAAFTRLHDADVLLKTSGRAPELVLQELILSICTVEKAPGMRRKTR
jgi:DNA polymerase-3 subunit delta